MAAVCSQPARILKVVAHGPFPDLRTGESGEFALQKEGDKSRPTGRAREKRNGQAYGSSIAQ